MRLPESEHYKQILKSYNGWLDTLGFADSSVDDFTKHIRDFMLWLECKDIPLVNLLTQQIIDEYFNYLECRPNQRKAGFVLGQSNLNRNFLAVDKLLEFLHHRGLKQLPAPTLFRIKPDNQSRIDKINPLTKEEVKILYASIDKTYSDFNFQHRQAKHYQLRLVFALYYGCGLRRSEGYNLTADDIDFSQRLVYIRQGKGYKDRVIPMSDRVYQELQNYIYNFRHSIKLKHKRLFINTAGTLLLSLQHLQSCCDNEMIKAKHINLHTLRHSIATHLLQNGMSIENIALFLGHDSLESTQIYTHLM